MRHPYLTLDWVLGILFLLTGFLSSVEVPLAGLCLIAIALLLLPPVRSFVYSKTDKELPLKARTISTFVLFIAFGVFVWQAQFRKEQELAVQRAARMRPEIIKYFNANRKLIISSVSKALSEKLYQSAISQSNDFLVSGDEELEKMNARAKKELEALQKTEKREQLLAELRSIPVKEYVKNKTLYQELLNLHPGNGKYKRKVAFYARKIEEEKHLRAIEVAAAAEAQRLARKWTYRLKEDPMTSRKAKYATIESENTVSFYFPYEGSQRATLMLGDHPTYGQNVILSIERGQFLCRSYSDCQIRVRFDEDTSEPWNVVGADNSTTSIFLRHESEFIRKLRAAQIVHLQARTSQGREPIFEFQVGGFDYARYRSGN